MNDQTQIAQLTAAVQQLSQRVVHLEHFIRVMDARMRALEGVAVQRPAGTGQMPASPPQARPVPNAPRVRGKGDVVDEWVNNFGVPPPPPGSRKG